MSDSIRQTFLPFALPDFDESELAGVKEVLESGWITTGPKTQKFETDFAAAVGAKHAVAVNSCTAALHLALEAIGIGRGDEVITSPYTFAATAEVVRYFDARPVLVDIQPRDFNIDPKLIEHAISPRTRAIIPIHVAGVAADLGAIEEIAERHGLAVIEDAAHAFPAMYGDRIVGAPGRSSEATGALGQQKRAVCFSFYATKTLTTGEGGMICTDSDSLASRCRMMALHGISRDAWKRYTSEGTWYYEIVAPGYKYNLTDIASALGLAQLAKAQRMAERRRVIAQAYNKAFRELPELEVPFDPDVSAQAIGDALGPTKQRHAWHLYMLRLNLDRLRLGRDEFVDRLRHANIGTSVHFIPLHLHPYYRETYGYSPEDYPVSYKEYLREVSLPIYSKMTDSDVEDVILAVRAVVFEHAV